MKSIIIASFCLCFFQLIGQEKYTNKNGNEHLWGNIEVSHLQEEPYRDWYNKNYDDQKTDLNISDVAGLKDVTVKVFLGTWCGDTKRLMPRFIKTWTELGLSTDQLQLIALHNEDDLYKQAPDDIALQYNIHRVPTFVFEKDGVELNRIVERTVFDLDTDLKAIANDFPYKPRYKAVQIMNEFMNDTPIDSLTTKSAINNAYRKIARELSSSSELNTYGYVLMAAQQLEKAEYIFKLNRYIFPYDPNTRDSYGEILLKNKKLEEAQTEYYEALRIKQTDEHIIKQLAQIDELIQAE